MGYPKDLAACVDELKSGELVKRRVNGRVVEKLQQVSKSWRGEVLS